MRPNWCAFRAHRGTRHLIVAVGPRASSGKNYTNLVLSQTLIYPTTLMLLHLARQPRPNTIAVCD
jgi:hypothetical protein|eukprot:COSAG01_NODE_7255_length_3280_cov_2.188934_2_plen_65_part_00